MVEAMRVAEDAANARVTADQAGITYGDHWMSAFDDVLIFGRVNPLDELDEANRQLGMGRTEMRTEREMIEIAYRRGYRYGRCYSVIVPEGEWGSTHVVKMVPITAEQYAAAESHGWFTTDIIACEECRPWLRNAVVQWNRQVNR
jgi:hypothetical protein